MITPRELTTKTAEMDFSGEYNWKNQEFEYNAQYPQKEKPGFHTIGWADRP